MQKLFENWREFRKEVLNEITPDIIDHSPELHTRKTLSSSLDKNDLDVIRQVLSIADPTGILSWPDVVPAYRNLEKEKTLLAGGGFLLALLAVIPVAGKLAAPAKVAKLSKVATTVKKASKILDKASDSKKIISQIAEKHKEVLKGLSSYMHTTQGLGMFGKERLQALLKMARAGKAVSYSGKAYRGARADDVLHLVDQLNIPGIVKKRDGLDYSKVRAGRATLDDISNQADHFFKRELQKMNNKPGEWVEISLPTKGVTLSGRGGESLEAASFAKNWKSAESFADTSVYANRGDKFEIMFQSSGDNFVDAAKTLDKHGVEVADFLRKESEVLAIGEVPVEKIFVRRLQ